MPSSGRRHRWDLAAANVETELTEQLKTAAPLPATGTTLVAGSQTSLVRVEVPFSERAWYFQRGELTLLVAARIRYRDRVCRREKLICQFTNPQSGSWASCPFLNN